MSETAMNTLLCIPITATTPKGIVLEAAAAGEAGAEIIELRLDYLDLNTPQSCLRELWEAAHYQPRMIITCRVAEEGGHYRGDDRFRAGLIGQVLAYVRSRATVDLEYSAYRKSTELQALAESLYTVFPQTPEMRTSTIESGACLVLSRHDFRGTPPDVSAWIREMGSEPCEVLKVACKANRITDSLRVLDALHEWAPKRPTIALAMGEAGLITRVLAKKFGAFLTFASLEAGKESAPGQLTISEMRNVYRWDKLDADTKVYGVIGCPVGHSMSPAMHNAAFEAVGHNGVYLPLLVEPDYASFAAFVDGCLARPWLDFHGCSVTIPHKENLLRYVAERGGEIEPLAARLGVANTLVIAPAAAEGKGPCSGPVPLYACNTDWAGALDALCAGMGIEPSGLKGLRVAVLGAGGAARAIVAGLCDSGCVVTIYNRTFEKAKALAEQFGATTRAWDERERMGADVIVNCTSIGMWPKVDETPLPNWPSAAPVVFDTVYNPLETRLLREARERGCRTIEGLGMLVHQAARQFKLWTGQPAPLELMDRIVRERLNAAKR